jgi:hypothetical protein
MTNWSEINTFEDMLVSANAGGPFWTMILFMLYAVLLITFFPFGTSIAVMSAGFIGFFIGLFLVYMGLVSWKWVLALLGTVILMIIWETLFAKKE